MSEIKIRKFRLAPPPTELPIYGKINSSECCFFGRTNYQAILEEKRFILELNEKIENVIYM
jgi:hypothetical protein